MKITKKELLNSPERQWNDTEKLYDWVLIVQGRTKHDSGYMHQILIGCTVENDKESYEILGYPDDIEWQFPTIKLSPTHSIGTVRTDCYYPQGVFRFWGRGKFNVSEALSSMTVTFIQDNT